MKPGGITMIDEPALNALVDFQKRVIAEKAELDERLERLLSFTRYIVYGGLNQAEQDRLKRQAAAMKAYSAALGERIEAFKDGLARGFAPIGQRP